MKRLRLVLGRLGLSRRGLERLSALGVFAFVIAKFAPVAGVLGSYGVNPWIFLAIDVVTIWPYVKGVSNLLRCMARNDPLTRCALWAVVITGSFVAPYTYLYIAGGQEFPLVVDLIIGLVVVALAIQAMREINKRRQITRT